MYSMMHDRISNTICIVMLDMIYHLFYDLAGHSSMHNSQYAYCTRHSCMHNSPYASCTRHSSMHKSPYASCAKHSYMHNWRFEYNLSYDVWSDVLTPVLLFFVIPQQFICVVWVLELSVHILEWIFTVRLNVEVWMPHVHFFSQCSSEARIAIVRHRVVGHAS